MTKAKCIECGNEIKLSQLLMHNWKKPVICASCGTRMTFDKKEWKEATMPAALVAFALVVAVFAGSKLSKEFAAILLLTGLFLLLVASIWLGVKIRSIKLVLAKKT